MVMKLYSYLYLGDKWYLQSYTNATVNMHICMHLFAYKGLYIVVAEDLHVMYKKIL